MTKNSDELDKEIKKAQQALRHAREVLRRLKVKKKRSEVNAQEK